MARLSCSRLLPLLLLLMVVVVMTLLDACSGLPLDGTDKPKPLSTPRGADVSTSCLRCICAARQCDFTYGCANDVCGGFQITEGYFNHSNITREKPLYRDRTFISCTTDISCAIEVVRLYMSTLATDCNEDGNIDCNDMMMTHYIGIEDCIGAQDRVEFSNEWKYYENCAKGLK